MLRRNLRLQHGLERAAYCARWQLPPDHPITAPEYSARCSALAKDGRCADRCRARRACRTNAGARRDRPGRPPPAPSLLVTTRGYPSPLGGSAARRKPKPRQPLADAHAAAGFAHQAFEYIAHAEFEPDLLYVLKRCGSPFLFVRVKKLQVGPCDGFWATMATARISGGQPMRSPKAVTRNSRSVSAQHFPIATPFDLPETTEC
jgi:hypothetical protein